MADETHPKVRIRDWKGLLAQEGRKTKFIVFLLLLLASASMTFMQLGFIGVGVVGDYSAYILALLVPIAIAALLLGKGWATLEGLLCGAVLFAHARWQPLDLYELYFVGPMNSFAIYSTMGFAFGLAFAIALRNKPTGARRIVYIVIVCLIMAAVSSVSFIVNTFIDVSIASISYYLEDGGVPKEILYAVSGFGDSIEQMALDGGLLCLFTLVVDYYLARYQEQRAYVSALTIFRRRLILAAVVVFAVVQAGAFVTITMRAEATAEKQMEGEIDFIGVQLESKIHYADKIIDEKGELNLTDKQFFSLIEDASAEQLIGGYDLTDGTVVVFSDGIVLYSSGPAFPVGATLDDLYGEYSPIVKELGKTDRMRRVVYSTRSPEELETSSDTSGIELGYMCAKQVGDYIVMMSKPASMVFTERYVTMRWATILALVLLVVVSALAARLLRKIMAEPIVRTNESLAEIAHGNLDTIVAETDSVELTMLSAGINTTVGALKDFINEAERRNERDLATAKRIQESALPRTFPPFPEIDKFDIFASMNAAKEVGGDFYDFFLIDDHTLGFLIADVSGKGIPGALFMMAAKTEIENYMSTGMNVSEAIASANRRLCANNDAGMFVTVWAASLDYQTGELTYVNAGHNFPLLRHGSGGEWEWLKKKCGLFLGTFETAKYRQETLTLAPGDEILLYTDGVNEAFNVSEEEYGNDRLEAFLAVHNNLHAREMVRSLRADVAAWAEGAEQSDDVTILVLEYGVAPEVTGSITVPATLDYLDAVTQLIDDELERRLCPVGVQNKIDVAIEELFVNVCRYAYAGQREPGQVQVSYAYGTDPSSMTIEMRDQGVPFDPLTREDPTKPSNIRETKVGGLGIFMVKRSMDDFMYMYDKDTNVVVFKKGW